MKNKLLSLLIIVFGILVLAGCGSGDSSGESESAVEKSDSTEETTEETTSEESKLETDGDIIATTVAIGEIMERLELDLVGVRTRYKDLPERYSDAIEVSLAMIPVMEIIMLLKLTDVLSVRPLQVDLEESFEKSDTPVTFVDLESVEGMYDSILALGEKYDRTEQAEDIVNSFEEKLSETEKKVEGKEPPKVLILLGVPGS